jgi:hypothetical protein
VPSPKYPNESCQVPHTVAPGAPARDRRPIWVGSPTSSDPEMHTAARASREISAAAAATTIIIEGRRQLSRTLDLGAYDKPQAISTDAAKN